MDEHSFVAQEKNLFILKLFNYIQRASLILIMTGITHVLI